MQYAPPLADGKAIDSAEDARDPCSGGGPFTSPAQIGMEVGAMIVHGLSMAG